MLPAPPSIHPERKKNRLTGFDYSSPGYYFVTICTENRVKCFGEVKDGVMVLNDIGKIVENFLKQIPFHYDGVVLDEFVVMPNHIHMVIEIENSDAGVRGTDGVTIGTDGGANVGTEHCSVPTPAVMVPAVMVPAVMVPAVMVPAVMVPAVMVPAVMTPTTVVPASITPPTTPTFGLLSKIIKSFKEACTKNIKNKFGAQKFVWQRSFYDCIIRNENAYTRIKYYIQDNPAKWDRDRNNPPNLYM